MNQSPLPKAITVTSVLWLGFGSLMMLSGLRDTVRNSLSMIALSDATQTPLGDVVAQAGWLLALAFAIGVTGLAGIVGAIFLLRRKGWARRMMVGINVAAVGLVGIFAYLWQKQQVMMASAGSFWGKSYGSVFSLPWEQARDVFAGLALFACAAIPFVVMIKKLRSRRVVELCAG